jgi:pyrimidine operon attenuation protein/uracil phosphoribosyltransferase
VPDRTVVLDRDDIRRTLARIAHEIVERNPHAGSSPERGSPEGGSADTRSADGGSVDTGTPDGDSADIRSASPGGGSGPGTQGGVRGPRAEVRSAELAIVGIHRRGAVLAQRVHALVEEVLGAAIPLGSVDIAFYRDDLAIREGRQAFPVVRSTELNFPVDGLTIVIVDDVLYTGRTVRAAVEAIFDYGRPDRIQLAVLVDRGHRELPIRPDYVGKNIPTARSQRVDVRVREIDGQDVVRISDQVARGSEAA